MMEDTQALTVVLARTEGDFRRLEEKQADLEKTHVDLIRKTNAASDDAEALAQLKIEIEQTAEAKREIDRLIAQTARQMEMLEQTIAMQSQSDMA